MQGKSISRAALLAASIAGLGVFGGTVSNAVNPGTQEVHSMFDEAAPQQAPRSAQNGFARAAQQASVFNTIFGSGGRWKPARHPNGPGWTHAHVQRMARKRRQKIRNRKAHR